MFGFINTTLLWALAAIALPFLIHLLTRRKLRVVTVSTVAFLKRLEKEKIRQLKLRQLLLLILRMLIVALLVLAFTRPTLRRERTVLAARAAATAVVILDNSLSMAVAPEGVTMLSQARSQAVRLAELFSPGDEIFLITAAKPARFVSPAPLLSPERFSEAVASIPQTWAETDLAGALALAREVFERSRLVNRELYIFSDGRAELPAQSANPETKTGQGGVASIRGLHAYMIRFDQNAVNNLSLQAATLSNQIFERGKAFEVVATIANNGQRDINNQLAHLFLNGKRVAQQAVEVPVGAERRVSFRAVPDTSGFILGRIELEDDDLIFDNTRTFVFFIPPQRQVLAAAAEAEDLTYLRLAFDPATRSQTATKASDLWRETDAANLATERFDDYDVIILANVPRFSDAVAQRLINYLKNGGGVMVFLGSDVDLRNYNELFLSRIGAGTLGETMGQLSPGAASIAGDNTITLGRIDFSHPLFAGIFEKSEKAPRLDSPNFRFAVQMRLSSGSAPIMEYANGYPFLIERRVGNGQLLLFTSAASEKWSDFTFKGLFAPLMHRSISYLIQARDHQQEENFIGQELVANLRMPATALEMELPDGSRRKVPVQVVGQNYQMRYAEVDQPGHYRLWQADADSLFSNKRGQATAGTTAPIGVWSVNYNPAELKQPQLETSALQAASGAASLTFVSPGADVLAAVRQTRFGSELWKYFLAAAIIAMIVEMWLSRSTRQAQTGRGRQSSHEAASVTTSG